MAMISTKAQLARALDELTISWENSAAELAACQERCAQLESATVQTIAAAVAAEREACAVVAEVLPFKDCQMDDGRSDDIAAAIRARGRVAP